MSEPMWGRLLTCSRLAIGLPLGSRKATCWTMKRGEGGLSEQYWSLVYIGNTTSVVRFPYRNGDLKAAAESQIIVAELPGGGGHITRDFVFTADGKKMFVAVGSASNVNDPDTTPNDFHRANIMQFTPHGKFVKIRRSCDQSGH